MPTETLIMGAGYFSRIIRIIKSKLSHSDIFKQCYQRCRHVIPGADKVKNIVSSFDPNNKSNKAHATSLLRHGLMIREAAFPSPKIPMVELNWTANLPDHEITLSTWYKGSVFGNFLSTWSLNWMNASWKSTWTQDQRQIFLQTIG